MLPSRGPALLVLLTLTGVLARAASPSQPVPGTRERGRGLQVQSGDCTATSITLSQQADVAKLAGCTSLPGDLEITGDVSDLSPLLSVKALRGNLVVSKTTALTSLSGLDSLATLELLRVWENEKLRSLKGLEGLKSIDDLSVRRNAALVDLQGLEGLVFVEKRVEVQDNTVMTSLTGLDSLVEIGQAMNVKNNPALLSIGGFRSLKYCWGGYEIEGNPALRSLAGLSSVVASGTAEIKDNRGMKSLGGPFSLGPAHFRSLYIADTSWPSCVTPQERAVFDGLSSTAEHDDYVPNATWLQWRANACGPGPFTCYVGMKCHVDLGVDKALRKVQLASFGCGVCKSFRTVAANGSITFDMAMPGSYTLCSCDSEDRESLTQVDVLGPKSNTDVFGCHRGQLDCLIQLEGTGFTSNSTVFVRKCCEEDSKPVGAWARYVGPADQDTTHSIIQALADEQNFLGSAGSGSHLAKPGGDSKGGTGLGGVSTQRPQFLFHFQGQPFAGPSRPPGTFSLCWRPPCPAGTCSPVKLGTFNVLGPYITEEEGILGQTLVTVPNELGVAHRSSLVLKASCSDAEALSVPANGSQIEPFLLSLDSTLRPTSYRQCWCGKSYTDGCNTSSDFFVDVGGIQILCPAGQQPEEGICTLCLPGRHKPEVGNHSCYVKEIYIVVNCLQMVLYTYFFTLLLVSLRYPMRIDDSMSGKNHTTVLTLQKPHDLHMAGKESFPICLRGTKNRILENPPAGFWRARVATSQSLELLISDEDGYTFKTLNTSMGCVYLSLRDELRHRHRIPLGLQLFVLPFAFLLQLFDHQLAHRFFTILVSLAVALCLRVFSRHPSRNRTDLDKRIVQYRNFLKAANPEMGPCEKGPGRALELGALVNLYEHFAGYIRQRDAYYLDSNIMRPITQPYKLSFSEVVGPKQVQWFVSHVWSNPFADLCKSLRRHAESVTGTSPTLSVKGRNMRSSYLDPWRRVTYWVCFCSNNQYQLKAELGTDWSESSFFLTLKSGHCKGVCLVLDDMATPLTRAWCIFELLQTLKLERGDFCSEEDFSGLLLCTTGGILNFGQGSVEVAIELVERCANLDLESAGASRQQDKDMISAQVVRELGSFDAMNKVLRSKLHGLLETARHNADGHFERLFAQLRQCMAAGKVPEPVIIGHTEV